MISEAEKKKAEKAKIHEHWLSIERARKRREKYEISEFSGWMYVGPTLGFIVSVIVGFMIWSVGTENAGNLGWFFGIGILPITLLGFTSDIDEKWKASISAKEELQEVDPKEESSELKDFSGPHRLLHGYKYKYGHIYTDSVISYRFYQFAKFICGFSTLIFGASVAVLLFIWIGSISIAPTSIIIILLILILLKE